MGGGVASPPDSAQHLNHCGPLTAIFGQSLEGLQAD